MKLAYNNATGMYSVQNQVPSSDFGNGLNCWSRRSVYKNGPNYITAVNRDYITSFNKTTGDLVTQKNFTNGNPNLIEMAVANSYVYALSFGNETYPQHIQVAKDVDLSGDLVGIQNFQVPSVNFDIEGLAVFVPNDPNNYCDVY